MCEPAWYVLEYRDVEHGPAGTLLGYCTGAGTVAQLSMHVSQFV